MDVEAVRRDLHRDHAGAGVERTVLVEDEVADAVIDGSSAIVFDGLQGVRMMADDEVGTGIHQTAGETTLQGLGSLMMLPSPMGRDNDDGSRICMAQVGHTTDEVVVIFLTDAPAVG